MSEEGLEDSVSESTESPLDKKPDEDFNALLEDLFGSEQQEGCSPPVAPPQEPEASSEEVQASTPQEPESQALDSDPAPEPTSPPEPEPQTETETETEPQIQSQESDPATSAEPEVVRMRRAIAKAANLLEMVILQPTSKTDHRPLLVARARSYLLGAL